MPSFLFLLSKLNFGMSVAELSAFLQLKDYESYDGVVVAETRRKKFSGLAYTKAAYKILFSSSLKSFESEFQNFKWKDIIKHDFCVRIHGKKDLKEKNVLLFDEEILAGYIWNRVESPKVNLKDPDVSVEIFEIGGRVYCSLLSWKNSERFEERKPHLKPNMVPISLDPRLARALVNLTGIQKGTILDPFCGVGGILVEAGLRNLKVVGFDLDGDMVRMAEENLKFYRIKDYSLKVQDSLFLSKKYDYIVTDLPYGKNSGKADLNKLYYTFLKILEKVMRKKAVIVFPDCVDARHLISRTDLSIVLEFDYYIHKSMTKKIFVLEQ